ncbi:MAG: gliding motility protein GldC [Gammaproteobacteria bacterium]
MSRNAEINLSVSLDDQNLPTRIEWEATEAEHTGPRTCQSMMLSLWDNDHKTAVAIDLWTRDTTVEDMNLHVYQVIHKLADTYRRATNNVSLAERIHAFGTEFGDSVGLVSKDDASNTDTEHGDAAA